MSLGIVVKGADGVVLASDTRITLTAQMQGSPAFNVNFDNATKILTFGEPHNHVAALTYGAAVIGNRTAHSFVPELELELKHGGRKTILEYANKMSDFFLKRWKESMNSNQPPSGTMTFIVGGYNRDAPYGAVFLFDIPDNPGPREQNPKDFGMTMGGQYQMASRIIQGYDPALLAILDNRPDLTDSQVQGIRQDLKSLQHTIPIHVLALQDCVDLATFLIRTTITAQDLAIGLRGVGGTIEVA